MIVSVSKETQIGINLEVGVPSETVTVSSTQEVINTASPTLTNVINTRQVGDLPLALVDHPLGELRVEGWAGRHHRHRARLGGRRAGEIDLLKTLLHYLETKTTCMTDAPWRNEVTAFTCPERHQRELDILIRKRPLVMGLSLVFATEGLVYGLWLLLFGGTLFAWATVGFMLESRD